jgi:hypothetical protein
VGKWKRIIGDGAGRKEGRKEWEMEEGMGEGNRRMGGVTRSGDGSCRDGRRGREGAGRKGGRSGKWKEEWGGGEEENGRSNEKWRR